MDEPQDNLHAFSNAELRSKVVVLECANWQAEQRIEFLEIELSAASARERWYQRQLRRVGTPPPLRIFATATGNAGL